MSLQNELGQFIQETREKQRLSQAQLAERTGISRASISQLETSKIERPKLAVLTALADGLGVAPAALFEKAGVTLPDAASAQLQWFAEQLDARHLRLLLGIARELLREQQNQPPPASPKGARPKR